MDIKRIVPWNWFKKEEEDTGKTVPVKHQDVQKFGWDMGGPFQQLHREMDRLFDRTFRDFGISPFGFDRTSATRLADEMMKPTLDLSATDSEYTVTVEIPGVDEKDINLEVGNDTLTIRGEKKLEEEEKNKNYYRMERAYGSFQRVLSLPDDADQDNVKATFNKGVLKVRAPRKAISKSHVKQIEVKSA